MISIESLNKVFKNSDKSNFYALKNINLKIQEGEIYGIIGLSGAGKSTLIRCLNRLEEPSSGEIYIDNSDITKYNTSQLRELRKSIGMIFQHFNILSSRTVFQNIAFPLEISGYSKNEIKKRVEKLLELVELSDKRDTYPSQLSGGQKQRVAIARALANEPKILLSDESTSALDPKTTKSILNLIKKIQKEMSLTVILITHQMEVIKEICDKVAIIEDGEIIESGNVEDIFASPKTKTAKAFVSSIHTNTEEELNFPKIKGTKVIKLKFLGETSKEPLVSQAIKKFDIDINILSGNISELMKTSVGHLIIQVFGKCNEIEKTLHWFNTNKVNTEVIWNG